MLFWEEMEGAQRSAIFLVKTVFCVSEFYHLKFVSQRKEKDKLCFFSHVCMYVCKCKNSSANSVQSRKVWNRWLKVLGMSVEKRLSVADNDIFTEK